MHHIHFVTKANTTSDADDGRTPGQSSWAASLWAYGAHLVLCASKTIGGLVVKYLAKQLYVADMTDEDM